MKIQLLVNFLVLLNVSFATQSRWVVNRGHTSSIGKPKVRTRS